MDRKQRLHLSLSPAVVERLEEKDNMSGFVDETLREKFDL